MKRFLLSLVLALGLIAPAAAQVNTVPQVGTISAYLKEYTYSAISRGLAPAASATDIFCIQGGTRAISVKEIRLTGTAGTLVTAPFTLVRRTSLNTAGTAATGAALPVAAPHISTDPAASASLNAWTANPTLNDSSPTYYRTGWATLPVTSAGTSINPLVWQFSDAIAAFSKGLDIPAGATTQAYCINLNAVSVSSGLLDISITWTER